MSSSAHDGPGVSPDAQAVIDAYLGRFRGALLGVAPAERAEILDDIRGHVLERMARTAGTLLDAERALAELGTPEDLAARYSDAAVSSFVGDATDSRSPLSGRLLGVPYELRPPTAERIAARWWDPRNPRVLVPRVFGAGWDLNFGALAVMMGIVRPDDEDEPFASVPPRWMSLTIVVPVAFAALFVGLVLAFQSSLPAQVAVHYSLWGVPDRYAPKAEALILPGVMALAGLIVCGGAWVRRARPLSRAAAGAFAVFLASISIGVYAQQVVAASGSTNAAAIWLAIAGCILIPFALLVTLSRIGRAAEMRRDLDRKGRLS